MWVLVYEFLILCYISGICGWKALNRLNNCNILITKSLILAEFFDEIMIERGLSSWMMSVLIVNPLNLVTILKFTWYSLKSTSMWHLPAVYTKSFSLVQLIAHLLQWLDLLCCCLDHDHYLYKHEITDNSVSTEIISWSSSFSLGFSQIWSGLNEDIMPCCSTNNIVKLSALSVCYFYFGAVWPNHRFLILYCFKEELKHNYV